MTFFAKSIKIVFKIVFNDKGANVKLFLNEVQWAMACTNDPLSDQISTYLASIDFSNYINTFSKSRDTEFRIGRACAAIAYEQLTHKKLLVLPMNADRSPAWPNDVVGSITHNKKYILAAVADRKNFGLGIDVEELGSADLKLKNLITHQNDISSHHQIQDSELLTYIFSIKESVFKTLYPLIQTFIDFESAAVIEIQTTDQSFIVEINASVTNLICEKNIFLTNLIDKSVLKNIRRGKNKNILIKGNYMLLDSTTLLTAIILN